MLGTDGRLYDSDFDFDGDGKLDAYEYAVMDDVVFGNVQNSVEENEFEDELMEAGIDLMELEDMNSDERLEVLEAAGLDPDDYELE